MQRLKAIKKFKKLCIKSHQILTEETQAMSKLKQELIEVGDKLPVGVPLHENLVSDLHPESFLTQNDLSKKLLDSNWKKKNEKSLKNVSTSPKQLKCHFKDCQNRYFTKQERLDAHLRSHSGIKVCIYTHL